MDWFELPTEKDLYLADVIWPQIKTWYSDADGHFVISEWKDDTFNEIKEKAKTYDNIIVQANKR